MRTGTPNGSGPGSAPPTAPGWWPAAPMITAWSSGESSVITGRSVSSHRMSRACPRTAAVLAAVLAGAGASNGAGKEIAVSSPAALSAALAQARPGDTLLLPDGTYRDQELRLRAPGAEGKPVTVRAATPGKVVFTGKSFLEV